MDATVTNHIQNALNKAFGGAKIDIVNESGRHAGHLGAKASLPGNSHFYIQITSLKFQHLTPIQRQRIVHKSLDTVIQNHAIHAVRFKLQTPKEKNSNL